MEVMMVKQRTDRIRQAFGTAALGYEDSAGVQRIAAETLAKLAAQRRLPLVPRILEIGCGTGLLTRHIRTQWPEAELTVTDLAPEMVERAARDPRLAGDRRGAGRGRRVYIRYDIGGS